MPNLQAIENILIPLSVHKVTSCFKPLHYETLTKHFVMEVYQSSERASVRLAARGSVPEQISSIQSPHFSSPPPQDIAFAPYSTPALYPQQHSIIVPVVSSPHQGGGSESTSAKRPLPEPQTAPAPKAKRVREKFKMTTPGTQEVSTTSSGKYFLFEYRSFSIGASRFA
jgi:hypothetical protein